MSAINVPAVVAAFEPRFEGEAVPSWDDVEALEETGALAPEVEAAVERPTTEVIGMPAALDDNPGLYMLVAGAFSMEANAQVLANDLVANGFDAQVFEQDGGLHIVTYATHLDEQSARMHLEELRTQRISENAWLKPWKVIR
jgi:cell division septation protein DedD